MVEKSLLGEELPNPYTTSEDIPAQGVFRVCGIEPEKQMVSPV